MKQRIFSLLVSVLLFFSLNSQAAELFPSFTAINLLGQPFQFASSLKTEKALVIVAFSDKQQPMIDPWLKALHTLKASKPKLSYYEIPVLPQKYKYSRSFIDGYMRNKVPNKDFQRQIVPYYTDVKKLKQSLGIQNEKEIYLYLTDQNGKIVWKNAGAYTLAKLSALSSQL